jgi:hypothetical protein
MNHTPAPTLEICQRPFNAGVCQGVIYHPQPDLRMCARCGGSDPGAMYELKKEAP